jgi:hypothetical protein
MMSIRDDWGKDPSVQSMRRVFAYIETAQGKLLGRLNISPYDNRLRRWREEARTLLDRACALAAKRGAFLSEEYVASIYLHCLGQTLSLDGVEVPSDVLPRDEGVISLFSEGKL